MRITLKPQHSPFTTMEGVKALIFDVFGTVVDWRGSIVVELETLRKEHGLPPGTVGSLLKSI